MRPKTLFEHVLKTRNHLRILQILWNCTDAMSGRQISRATGVNITTTRQVLESLTECGLVDIVDIPPAKAHSLNREHYSFVLLAPILSIGSEQSEFITMGTALATSFSHDLVSIILFGSYARGEESEDSDLDLLFIVNSEVPDLEDVSSFQEKANHITGEQTQIIVKTSSEVRDGVKRKQGFLGSLLSFNESIYGLSLGEVLSGK